MTKDELVEYCLTFLGAYEDHPFGPESTTMRHAGNKKMFALIMELGGRPCVNLKCEPERADFLRGMFKDVTPGYHMNKAHWNTVYLDGELPDDDIQELVRHSFELTRPKMSRKRKLD
ncbi:MmcQ/YjbR family DNA-binding protein [Paenibacillus hubeiensis]|uniref:MmcQ/YjbR family DNA-binding protein n=1 Tax=Paenibacillus hubeiensis TaxID=3077330 RepID=UPI0031BB6DEF